MTVYTIYQQLAEILAKAEPARIMEMKASDEMQTRLETLIDKSREGLLNRDEKDELDHFIVLERLMRLTKIKGNRNHPLSSIPIKTNRTGYPQ